MLRHLLLMRHAKSSWSDPDQSDHERPLSKRGRRSADVVGQVLHSRGYAPDLIWSSDSARTKETAKRLLRIIPGAQTALYAPQLYLASADQILELCAARGEPDLGSHMEQERGGGVLMVLGHNPGLGQLYEMLSGRAHAFPTASCAVFERMGADAESESVDDWLSPQCWRLVDLLLARDLMERGDE